MAKKVCGLLVSLVLALTACSQPQIITAATASPSNELTIPSAAPVVRPTPPPRPPLPDRPVTTMAEIVEGAVIARSQQRGVEITPGEWQGLRDYICNDLASGGSGRWLNDAGKVASAEIQQELADLNLDGATISQCPDLKPELPPGVYSTSNISDDLAHLTRLALMRDDYEYDKLLSKYTEDLVAYGELYGVDVTGYLEVLTERGGGGYKTVCADGWVSSSGGEQGACSHHGGLR